MQNNILLFLIYYYQRRSLSRSVTLVALLAGCGFLALSGALSSSAISTLYDCNNLILIASRCSAWVKLTAQWQLALADCWPASACLTVPVMPSCSTAP